MSHSRTTTMHFHKRECLNRAKLLFSQQEEAALRYACLELRGCIESIAYEKLQTYMKRLPAAILETWQPPQIFKALQEFEPSAVQDFSLRICAEDSSGQPTGEWKSLGEHKTFRLAWLRKTYNSLGNHLHVPLPPISRAPAKLDARKADLRKLVEETIRTLEPIAETTMDCSIAEVIEFECSECKSFIVRSREGLDRDRSVTCLNPNCRAEYDARKNDNESTFEFVWRATTFFCRSCENPIPVGNQKLKIGYVFKCLKCNSTHQILQRQWGYALQEEA